MCNLYDKEKYVAHFRTLKHALNHGLLKKVHRVIKLNQKALLKPNSDMDTKLRTEAKNDFGKCFLKLMNNSVFEKAMENVRKHIYIKLVTTNKRKSRLVSEPNHHIRKSFSKNLLPIEMRKIKGKMDKSVYSGLSIFEISKTIVHEFWYDFIKTTVSQQYKTMLYGYK